MRKVIIVGGVAAGMSAASKAKREKKDLEMYMK
jgi:thioredoxin reductase